MNDLKFFVFFSLFKKVIFLCFTKITQKKSIFLELWIRLFMIYNLLILVILYYIVYTYTFISDIFQGSPCHLTYRGVYIYRRDTLLTSHVWVITYESLLMSHYVWVLRYDQLFMLLYLLVQKHRSDRFSVLHCSN